jgi:hypothetical protein
MASIYVDESGWEIQLINLKSQFEQKTILLLKKIKEKKSEW